MLPILKKFYEGENVKTRETLAAIFVVLLLVCYPVSASLPHDFKTKIGDTYTQPGKLKPFYKPSSFTASQSYSPSTDVERIGNIDGDIAEYKIRVKVGSGKKYESITLTNYVHEEAPWKANVTKNIMILTGQGLTEKFYSDMGIYYAKQEYSVYILDRRETNIPSDESDYTFMKTWTVDEHLKDISKGIVASRVHTAFLNGKPLEAIDLTLIGHSHGALLATAYEESSYDDRVQAAVDRIIPVDIIIKYNPGEQQLIEGQAAEFNEINEELGNGTYYTDNMGAMMNIAKFASESPSVSSPFPGLTNIQLFRLMASQTFMFSAHPYTQDYHYWTGDINGLYNVNESRLLHLTLSGGAVPCTPYIWMNIWPA